MEFRILGSLEVEHEGDLLKLGSAKQRAVLALLLLHANDVVPRERLIDELWGGEPPETARTALQVYVSQLRKALGRDVIVTKAPGYLIRVGPEELDLDRFDSLVDEARGEDAAGAAKLLRDALQLWRGPALEDLDPIARSERTRLEEQRLSALEQRIEAELTLGRHSELVPELEGLVRSHPLRDRLRGQLMLALYRSGRQADALEVYRSARRQLDEELGLEPGEELKRLERAILEQDPSLAAKRGSADARGDAHRHGHLPLHRHRGFDAARQRARRTVLGGADWSTSASLRSASTPTEGARSTRRAIRSSSPSGERRTPWPRPWTHSANSPPTPGRRASR